MSASETCVWERREGFLNNCRKKISKSRYDIKNGGLGVHVLTLSLDSVSLSFSGPHSEPLGWL